MCGLPPPPCSRPSASEAARPARAREPKWGAVTPVASIAPALQPLTRSHPLAPTRSCPTATSQRPCSGLTDAREAHVVPQGASERLDRGAVAAAKASHAVHRHPSCAWLPVAHPRQHLTQRHRSVERPAASRAADVVAARPLQQRFDGLDSHPAHANVVTLGRICEQRHARRPFERVAARERRAERPHHLRRREPRWKIAVREMRARRRRDRARIDATCRYGTRELASRVRAEGSPGRCGYIVRVIGRDRHTSRRCGAQRAAARSVNLVLLAAKLDVKYGRERIVRFRTQHRRHGRHRTVVVL
eukprot:4835291-Prymnesium_polylepis.4